MMRSNRGEDKESGNVCGIFVAFFVEFVDWSSFFDHVLGRFTEGKITVLLSSLIEIFLITF